MMMYDDVEPTFGLRRWRDSYLRTRRKYGYVFEGLGLKGVLYGKVCVKYGYSEAGTHARPWTQASSSYDSETVSWNKTAKVLEYFSHRGYVGH